MNSIEIALVGKIARDVELRQSQSGKPWARASIGVGSGEHTTWISIALFGVLAHEEVVGQLRKGVSVYIEGRDLGIDRYTTQAGEERVSLKAVATKIDVLGRIGHAKPPKVRTPPEGEYPAPVAAGGSQDWQRPLGDDAIPFAPAR